MLEVGKGAFKEFVSVHGVNIDPIYETDPTEQDFGSYNLKPFLILGEAREGFETSLKDFGYSYECTESKLISEPG